MTGGKRSGRPTCLLFLILYVDIGYCRFRNSQGTFDSPGYLAIISAPAVPRRGENQTKGEMPDNVACEINTVKMFV